MTHTFSFSGNLQAFELTFSGNVDCDDVVKLLSFCFEHPKFQFGSRYLFDFREAKIVFSLGDLHKLMNFIDNIRGTAKSLYRIVAVNSKATNLPVLKQWQDIVSGKDAEAFRISDSYDKATSWLQTALVNAKY